jgi:large subunit ribosomal protein L22
MTGPKLNERPGTRATLRGYHMSASKARVVLNLIRNEDVTTAREILAGTTREAADVIGKVLASAVANAVTNDGMQADELFVSACYADEGITMKRFTPRARGRAGKIRKRSCHITVIVSRLDDDRLEVLRSARTAQAAVSRTRRVASSRRRADQQASLNKRETAAEEAAEEAMEQDILDNEATENDAVVTDVMSSDVAETEADETDTMEFDTVDTPVEDLEENNEGDDVVVDETPGEEPATDEPVSDDTTEETK